MIKMFVVYKLEGTIDGISNEGVTYDENVLALRAMDSFSKNSHAELYIKRQLKDYKERNVHKNVKMIILETFIA